MAPYDGGENVAYPLKIQKVSREERKKRVEEALEMVHLERYGERYPSQLPGDSSSGWHWPGP